MRNDFKSTPQFNGTPIAFSKKPVVLTLAQSQLIEKTLTGLLMEVEDFTNKALKDKSLLKALNVPEDLDPTPTPLGLHIPFARFDFLFDGKNIQSLELNTDGTSGYNVTEWVAAEAGIPAKENPNHDLSARVFSALKEHDPKAEEIILVDLPQIGTSWEQHDLVKRWQVLKPNSHFADPAFKSWKKGALCYRRILSWQLRSQPERAKEFLKDWKEKNITVVGGWSSDVGMSKAWPIFLKPKCFLETILLDKDSAKKLENEKDNWVIKGALSYSGQAVFRGIDLPAPRWNFCIEKALAETLQGRHWIAQRRAEVPLVDGKPYELGLYFLNGKPSGYMCRWGSSDAISETSDEILRPIRIAT